MGLTDVTNEIKVQAEQQAQEIVAQAEAQASEITAKADAEVAEYADNAKKHSEQLRELTERKILAAARVDAQRLVLNTKKEAIDSVMDNVKEHFASLKQAERGTFLRNLLKKAKQEITVDTVFVQKKDKAVLKGVKAKEAEIAGGLVAQSKDGNVSVNLSVEELLQSVRQDVLVDVSEVLFTK